MRKFAIIAAGGSGSRMNTQTPKQFLLLAGRPVLWYTITTFLDAYPDLEIILVLPVNHFQEGEALVQSFDSPGRIHLVIGGDTRFHSVKKGLEFIVDPSIVFVHDGVRCLVTKTLIQRCYENTLLNGNAVPAVSSVDSMRLEKDGSNSSLDRARVKIIQTPQTFRSELIKKAFEQEYSESFTDEASVVERLDVKINLVQGEELNIKITHPADFAAAEKIIGSRLG
jgi:2-C-methyl-D-erythritol 4-phosphate cytidylyltransferase